ncbi:MAG: sigma-70 family RNA polymerase sigma factor [Butyricimonas faecihominis]
MDAEEDLILARIKKRDKEAFRYLYEYYFAKMVLFAESYLYDEEEARDLVQDLFFHLWNHAGTLQVTTSVKAYLFTSVRNRCLNAIRDRKIRDEHNNKIG